MSDHRYGCFDRKPFLDGHHVTGIKVTPTLDPLKQKITPVVIWIPNRASTDCCHDKKATDPACKGCFWAKEYP